MGGLHVASDEKRKISFPGYSPELSESSAKHIYFWLRRGGASRRRYPVPSSVIPAMPDAGKKRSYDEEDEPSGKKTRGDGDSKDSAVHVYQPCVVLPELAGKMNSLVEVRLRARILGALCVSPPAF